MANLDFISSIKDGAIKAQEQFGICASMSIAQAVLESGWGKSAPGNNLFGIKWTEGCGYSKQLQNTKEYVNGVWITVQAFFRSYNTPADSLCDHVQFLLKNSRYANLIGIKDYKTACLLIRIDGYCTDPDYTNKLIQIIEENNLAQFDNVKVSTATEALQYDMNIDYNAKISVTGTITNELLANLNGIKGLLVKGHKSHVVQWIQQKLIGWGYLHRGSDDGILGEETFQAITNLQKNWGQPTSGIMELDTWAIFLNK